jgi:hypothetical protein
MKRFVANGSSLNGDLGVRLNNTFTIYMKVLNFQGNTRVKPNASPRYTFTEFDRSSYGFSH